MGALRSAASLAGTSASGASSVADAARQGSQPANSGAPGGDGSASTGGRLSGLASQLRRGQHVKDACADRRPKPEGRRQRGPLLRSQTAGGLKVWRLIPSIARPSATANTPEPVTPYQKAQQVWDERMGSARVQASNWRIAALCRYGTLNGVGSHADGVDRPVQRGALRGRGRSSRRGARGRAGIRGLPAVRCPDRALPGALHRKRPLAVDRPGHRADELAAGV